MQTTIKSCRKKGYVSNILVEEFILEELMIKILVLEAFKKEQLINAPIQGSAADIIRLAMIKIDKILEKKKSQYVASNS